MINSTEFESLAEFLNTDGGGYVILHQERARTGDDHSGASIVLSKLAERFGHFLGDLKSSLGAPIKTATEWDLGIPTFASGNGYALWSIGENFVSLFVSWDNPEDPAFIIVGRAPLPH